MSLLVRSSGTTWERLCSLDDQFARNPDRPQRVQTSVLVDMGPRRVELA